MRSILLFPFSLKFLRILISPVCDRKRRLLGRFVNIVWRLFILCLLSLFPPLIPATVVNFFFNDQLYLRIRRVRVKLVEPGQHAPPRPYDDALRVEFLPGRVAVTAVVESARNGVVNRPVRLEVGAASRRHKASKGGRIWRSRLVCRRRQIQREVGVFAVEWIGKAHARDILPPFLP